jgi:fructan beta-fructosidase
MDKLMYLSALLIVALGLIFTSVNAEIIASYNDHPLRPQLVYTPKGEKDPDGNPYGGTKAGDAEPVWDINGLIYYDGEYHQMFLSKPKRNTYWLQQISTDLFHWNDTWSPAFGGEEDNEDAISGSAVVDYNNSLGLQVGDTKTLVAFYTERFDRGQCIAYSTDKGRTWKYWEGPHTAADGKYNNACIPKNTSGSYAGLPQLTGDARDPEVFWHEPTKKWIMVLFAGEGQSENRFVFFQSTNLKDWTIMDTYISNMYECPDFFGLPLDGDPNNIKWVALNVGNKYVVGSFDGTSWTKEQELMGDHFGRSSETFDNDPLGRRIHVSVVNHYYDGATWRFHPSFPFEMSLRTGSDGKIYLCQNPVREIATLYKIRHEHHNLSVSGTKSIVTEGEPLIEIKMVLKVTDQTEAGFTVAYGSESFTTKVKKDGMNVFGDWHSHEYLVGRDRAIVSIVIDKGSVYCCVDSGRVTTIKTMSKAAPSISLEAFSNSGTAVFELLEVNELWSIWDDEWQPTQIQEQRNRRMFQVEPAASGTRVFATDMLGRLLPGSFSQKDMPYGMYLIHESGCSARCIIPRISISGITK